MQKAQVSHGRLVEARRVGLGRGCRRRRAETAAAARAAGPGARGQGRPTRGGQGQELQQAVVHVQRGEAARRVYGAKRPVEFEEDWGGGVQGYLAIYKTPTRSRAPTHAPLTYARVRARGVPTKQTHAIPSGRCRAVCLPAVDGLTDAVAEVALPVRGQVAPSVAAVDVQPEHAKLVPLLQRSEARGQ